MRSYSYLMTPSGADDGHYVELPEMKFLELLRCMLLHVEVDEEWYRMKYPDVDQAIRAEEIESSRQHYIVSGYFENRFPRPILVNEGWYLEKYPDVAGGIDAGVVTSATEHFERDGFKEGRLPQPNWSLLEIAQLQKELTA